MGDQGKPLRSFFGLRCESWAEAPYEDLGKEIPGWGNVTFKGPVVITDLICSRSSEMVRVA